MEPFLTPTALAWIAVLLALTLLSWAPSTRWSLRRIPGPWSLPIVGHLPAIVANDLTSFLHQVARKYGPVAQVWFGARPWVLVSDAASIRKIAYKSVARPLSTNSFVHMLTGEQAHVDAEGLLFNRGVAWRASRRAFESSIMHPTRLASRTPMIRRNLDRFLSYLKPYAASGEAVEMRKAFGVLTLAIAGEAAYGIDFWPQQQDHDIPRDVTGVDGDSEGAVIELVRACSDCVTCLQMKHATVYLPLQIMFPSLRPLWMWLAAHLPDAAQWRHMRARQRVADVSRTLMRQWQEVRKAGGGSGGGCGISSSSFLAAMLEDRQRPHPQQQTDGGNKGNGAAGEELSRMTDLQVISQGLIFLLGGYETTSTTLAFATHLLATHPEVQSKLRSELAAHPGCLEDMEGLGQLPYLDAVVREAQRLYPVGAQLFRDATSDLDLGGGVVIPKGSFVCLSVYDVHRDPAQWPHPERFLPDRFLPETGGALGPADPSAFIPFGIGPRMCVGYKLATVTLKSSLACLLLHYRVGLHPRQPRGPLRLKTGLTLEPVDGVWVALSELVDT